MKGSAFDREPVRLAPIARTLGLGGRALSATGSCGVELWAIKTLTDPLASSVDLTPTPTSIAFLLGQSAPSPHNARTAPVETHAYTIQATLTGYKLEADSDIHLVLADGGKSMIAEIPDPACASGSRVLGQIGQARAEFLAAHNLAGGCFDCLSEPVNVTGVGFFDHLHGQNGVAANGVELHPVLAVSFGAGPAPPPPPPPVVPPPVKDDPLDELPGCAKYPGRIYLHHRKQTHCAATFFTTK